MLIYTTWPDGETAERAGRELVSSGRAACVNILPEAIAIYNWQGELQRDAEQPMLIKTTSARTDDVIRSVTQTHPYDVPAVMVLPIAGGAPDYLNWIGLQTADPITNSTGKDAKPSSK